MAERALVVPRVPGGRRTGSVPARTLRRFAAPAAILALVVVPLAALAVRAFADVWRAPALLPQELGLRGFEQIFSEGSGVGPAFAGSLTVATAATLAALVVAWPAARALAGARRARTALLVVLALPLLVPQYAVGTGLAEWFIRLGLADTFAGLALAHLVYVLPYVLLALSFGFGSAMDELEEAASTLGAGPLRKLAHVTLPAALPSLAVAAALGFVVSWSQYGTSLAVGGGRQTVPIVLVPFAQSDPQIAAALALVFLGPPLIVLLAAAPAGRRAA